MTPAEDRCINAGDGGCSGKVEIRPRFPGAIGAYPRCEAHYEERMAIEDQLNERYPAIAPRDFDPLAAGERWNEEDPWP